MKALFRNLVNDQIIEAYAAYDRAECSYGQGAWVDSASNETIGTVGYVPLGYEIVWIDYSEGDTDQL